MKGKKERKERIAKGYFEHHPNRRIWYCFSGWQRSFTTKREDFLASGTKWEGSTHFLRSNCKHANE